MVKYLTILLLCLQLLHSEGLGINEKLGDTVPLDLIFINEQSERVTLKELMDGKPTLLTLNYFKCAGICSPQLNDMAIMLSRLHLAENTDYKVITVDFAEDETPDLAVAKKKNLIHSMNRSYVQDAWHFVIGENNSSGKLADSVGFKFEKTVAANGQVDYIHGAALIVLSPTGKITRYMSGIEQLSTDVEMALGEAKKEMVSPTISKNSPYCFSKKQDGFIMVKMGSKIWAVLMMSVVIGLFVYLIRGSKRKENESEKDK
ncbi:SCO family protein [Sulfurimonas sp. SAG-AH-194-C21]|nr:SCO family protein [Sulfurimonas sp. SAG-AH-194-C21]MDF1882947.1 SCO family protein [Sulfurimonas sp. SAG-AH-194-C21]